MTLYEASPRTILSDEERNGPHVKVSGAQAQSILIPPDNIQPEPAPASAVAFDTRQDLLWTGNEWASRVVFLS